MNNTLKIVFGLFFIFSINLKAEPLDDLASNLSKQIKSTQTIRMAVLNFPYIDGFDSQGSKIVQERLTTAFSQNKKIKLVERALLNKVLEEKKIEMSGAFDEKTITELGKMLGVEAVLTGTLIDVNDTDTEINARIINVETGEIMALGKAEMKRIWKDKISTPKPIFEPTPLPKIEEAKVPESGFKIETEYTDVDTLEKYDEVSKFDKSEASPLEKAERWKKFAEEVPKYRDISLKRAKEWEDYDIASKKAEELKQKKLEAMKKDYQTLKRYFALSIISDEQKSDWARKFMDNYGDDNIYISEISKYLYLESDKKMNWNNARKYCKEKGRRLPKVAELRQMYEKECSGNKYDEERCHKWYWSSEDSKNSDCVKAVFFTNCVKVVVFTDGSVGSTGFKFMDHYVRCMPR
jgi:hypothetical protein